MRRQTQSLECCDSEAGDAKAASGKGKEQILPWTLQKEPTFHCKMNFRLLISRITTE